MPCPTFLPLLSLNITPGSMPQARPGLGGLTIGTGSIPQRPDRCNTCDSNSSDWNKLDIIQPTPKRLCNRSLKDCTYCTCNALHPCSAPSDWSSKDWDCDKQKQENRGHSLTSNYWMLRYKTQHGRQYQADKKRT